MLKKIMSLILPVLLFFPGTLLAAQPQSQPKRIAILPVYDESGQLTEDSRQKLQERIRQELHVPLNGTLQAVEYVPDETCAQALDTLMAQGKAQTGARMQNAMQPLADELSADVVVCVVITQYYAHYYMDWENERCIDSYAGLRIFGYDRCHNRSLDRRTTRWVNDTCSSGGTADDMLMQGLEELLQKAKLRATIYPLREAG